MLKYLRIAFSAVCGILCLLLAILWVRSYWWYDGVFFPGPHRIDSAQGRIFFDEHFRATGPLRVTQTYHLGDVRYQGQNPIKVGALMPVGVGRSIPHWLLLMAVSALVAVTWIRWRFSLRTLLIATMLIAVVLGAIVYAVK
jgi:hypothetical protein